jgi:cell division protease FtsH
VDVRLDLPNPTPKMVAAAIKQVTGQRATGLKLADITGPDFGELELALRDESRAHDCVQRLRRAAASAPLPLVPPGPRVEDLPLTGAVSAWTVDLLAKLRQVEAGTLAPATLAYPLLEGPPGVGKTLLAAAVARSASWRLVSTSVGSWFASSDGHLGGVIRAATGFVDDVLSLERTIGLIDEIDALPDRSALDAKNREWWTPVVAQVLLQIDRVRKSNRQALLIGATNFYDRLDGTLIRSGRLEQRVSVLPPQTVEEAARVLRHYLESDLDTATLDMAARLGIGATPATIEGWCRTARAKARAEARDLQPGDLLEAVAPADVRSPDETRAVAIHEAGHLAVARHLGVVVLGVSILANGRSGGHTLTETASRFPNRLELEIMATTLLGGRAADLTLGKGGHTGAEHDLAMATRMITDAITQFGLYGTLARPSDEVLGKGALFTQTDLILKRLLRSAIAIIVAESAPIQRLTERLIEERVMNGDAIAAIWAAPRGDRS